MTSYEQPLIDRLLRIIPRWRRRSRRFFKFSNYAFKAGVRSTSKQAIQQAMKGESLYSRMYSTDPETYSLIKIQNTTKRTETWTKTLQNVGRDPFKIF